MHFVTFFVSRGWFLLCRPPLLLSSLSTCSFSSSSSSSVTLWWRFVITLCLSRGWIRNCDLEFWSLWCHVFHGSFDLPTLCRNLWWAFPNSTSGHSAVVSGCCIGVLIERVDVSVTCPEVELGIPIWTSHSSRREVHLRIPIWTFFVSRGSFRNSHSLCPEVHLGFLIWTFFVSRGSFRNSCSLRLEVRLGIHISNFLTPENMLRRRYVATPNALRGWIRNS